MYAGDYVAHPQQKGRSMPDVTSTPGKTVRIPGPDHPITIVPNFNRIVVKVAGHVIADSRRTLTLAEAHYPQVHYVPRADVNMTLLQRSDHATYCPYKGECAYFSIPLGGSGADNAVWTYEAPFEAVTQIKDYLAFYPDRIDSIDEFRAS
jgi:uncharacterized protein (DUF427 family)